MQLDAKSVAVGRQRLIEIFGSAQAAVWEPAQAVRAGALE
jgi:hypothetical protein